VTTHHSPDPPGTHAPTAADASPRRRTGTLTAAVVAAGVVLAGGSYLLGDQVGSARAHSLAERRTEVAARGAQVMPFDLNRTTHVFDPTPDGGRQTVTADDPGDAEQVRLIREHLREERAAFARGDFTDPSAIHGRDMPGLRALEAGSRRIEVGYTELPGGAILRYTTTDPALVDALHAWFRAQVSDHGSHAEGGHP